MRLTAPDVLWVTHGEAEGDTKLNAFDNALISAGIGQWNLVKVTSVAPPNAVLTYKPIEIEAGSVVPAVLTSAQSDRPGELITACVGIGLSSSSHGMIMEHSGPGTPEQMDAIVRRMLDESFMRRGLKLEEVIVRTASHTVTHIGASVASVVLWWR
jgi:arginine decarboxylase